MVLLPQIRLAVLRAREQPAILLTPSSLSQEARMGASQAQKNPATGSAALFPAGTGADFVAEPGGTGGIPLGTYPSVTGICGKNCSVP